MQKYTKELADAKAENDVSAMMLPLVVVGCTSAVRQSVREATIASGVDNAASPDWQTPLNGDYFTLRERLITMQKQLEGTQKYINEQVDRASISMGNSCNYCEQYTRASSITPKVIKPSNPFTNVLLGFCFNNISAPPQF